MRAKSQPPEERDGTTLALNAAIETLNLAKEISSVTPAKVVFGTVSVILAMIRVSLLPSQPTDCGLKYTKDAMTNEAGYVELGLACAEVCAALDRGVRRKRLNDLNNSACEAINQLTT